MVGIFALVASLVFVGIQLKQSQGIAISQAFQSRTDITLSMHLTASENPIFVSAIARYLDGEPDSMTLEELVVMRQQAMMLLISGENLHYQYVVRFISKERELTDHAQLKKILEGKLVPLPVRQMFVESQDSYFPEFQECVTKILREIDSERSPD